MHKNQRIVVVWDDKGGVGKTTLALHLAAGLSLRSRPALLIDLDAQGSASRQLHPNPRATETEGTLGLLTATGQPDENALAYTPPSNRHLGCSFRFTPGKRNLKQIIHEPLDHNAIREYLASFPEEWIVIDVGRDYTLWTIAALLSDYVVVLATIDSDLGATDDAIEDVYDAKFDNPNLVIAGIAINRSAPHRPDWRSDELAVRECYGNQVFSTSIRDRALIQQARRRQRTVFDMHYGQTHPQTGLRSLRGGADTPARDLLSFVDEFLTRTSLLESKRRTELPGATLGRAVI